VSRKQRPTCRHQKGNGQNRGRQLRSGGHTAQLASIGRANMTVQFPTVCEPFRPRVPDSRQTQQRLLRP
jgi:hypothetical protein